MDRRTITEFAMRPSPFSTGTLTQTGLHNTEVAWKGSSISWLGFETFVLATGPENAAESS
jgi:hypothetical protein